ncbi:Uncharacterised protein [Mycobacterium tuberculosis]|nr:Uncharacterised protein [Mycobacterium tuberculosis]CKS69929.1 Uncharacterised protein [Mycobacterium tuberculosis]CKX14510.1 Uncharacterised protein [Mycobacterium tuberculosis]CPB63431.1 Uncharacterised protein [Mycobacterium tuberculosis]CPB66976.1 Uncharacterised protein [Mycobacterium tuberculosis]
MAGESRTVWAAAGLGVLVPVTVWYTTTVVSTIRTGRA